MKKLNEKMLFKQLENNIVEAFQPPEYAIANRFHIDKWSFQEMTEILNKCSTLSQVYKNKIQNAYQDIAVWPEKEYGLWENEQMYQLKMQNLRKDELPDN